MARISKSGLDYFPLDVNFLQDRKVRRISSRHHAAGIAALTSLFCLIYNEQRIKEKLGWMSPVEYRLNLLAA